MEPRLDLFWYVIKPGEELGASWGQVAGSLPRLDFVRSQLEDALREPEIEMRLKQVAYHVENYHIRVYELRERILTLVAKLSGDKKNVAKLRSPSHREAGFRALSATLPPDILASAARLIAMTSDDIGDRNEHTHNYYMSIGLVVGGNVYDPCDVIVDVTEFQADANEINQVVAVQTAELSNRFVKRVVDIISELVEFTRLASYVTKKSAPLSDSRQSV